MSPELSVKKSFQAYNFLHILYFLRATPNGSAGPTKNPRLLRAGEIETVKNWLHKKAPLCKGSWTGYNLKRNRK